MFQTTNQYLVFQGFPLFLSYFGFALNICLFPEYASYNGKSKKSKTSSHQPAIFSKPFFCFAKCRPWIPDSSSPPPRSFRSSSGDAAGWVPDRGPPDAASAPTCWSPGEKKHAVESVVTTDGIPHMYAFYCIYIYIFIYLFIYLFVYLFNFCNYLFIYLYIYTFIV